MFRITVNLKPLRTYGSIPFSYNQIVASALYKKLSLLGRFDDRFSVSNLIFKNMKADCGRIVPEGEVQFIASFMTKLSYQDVYECLIDKEFSVGDNIEMIPYIVSNVTKQQEVVVKNTMNYRTLSPIVVRRKQDNNNDLYLMPGDRDFNDMFFEHVYYKYLDFTGQRVNTSTCMYREKGKLYTKLLSIKKDNATLQVRGFVQEFSITAPVEIQQTLLYAGAGDMNSLGFGCVK
jgi:CRISPR-associated endoribonuclease Cas6